MNIEKITYKLISDTLEKGEITPFIVKMMISYLTDEQRGAILDEIVNERQSLLFKKGDKIWFDPKDNKYDLKEMYESDILKDSLLMNEQGYIKGTIIGDTSYRDECSPYATEYKVTVDFHAVKGDNSVKTVPSKEIRVNRSNIITLWKPLG